MEKSYVTMEQCFFCGEPKGILLDRRLRDSFDSPLTCINYEPCSKCKELMKQGIIIVIATDDSEGSSNPKRTGDVFVITEDGLDKLINDGATKDHILKCRFSFITESVAKRIGLLEEEEE